MEAFLYDFLIAQIIKAHLFKKQSIIPFHLSFSIYRNPYLFLCFSCKTWNLLVLLVRKVPNNLAIKLGKGHFSFL